MSLSVFAVEEWEKLKIAEKEFEELMSHRYRYDDDDEEDESSSGRQGTAQRQEIENKETKVKLTAVVSNACSEMDRVYVNKEAIVEVSIRQKQEPSHLVMFLHQLHHKVEKIEKELLLNKSRNMDFDAQHMLVVYLERDCREVYNIRVRMPTNPLVYPAEMTKEVYLSGKKTQRLLMFRDNLIQKIVGRDQLKGLPFVNDLFVILFQHFHLPQTEWTMETPAEMFKRYKHIHGTLQKPNNNRSHGKTYGNNKEKHGQNSVGYGPKADMKFQK